MRTEDELTRRLHEGWRLYRDSSGSQLYDPRSRRKERVDKSLFHLYKH
jgi:hypothetical protein